MRAEGEAISCFVANVSRNDIRDAFHLAFASFYKMDYLITWNCEHLANAHKQNHIRIINF